MKKQEGILGEPIKMLGLSKETYHLLRVGYVRSVGQLTKLFREDLEEMGLSFAQSSEVVRALRYLNLSLAQDEYFRQCTVCKQRIEGLELNLALVQLQIVNYKG